MTVPRLSQMAKDIEGMKEQIRAIRCLVEDVLEIVEKGSSEPSEALSSEEDTQDTPPKKRSLKKRGKG
jgi:hypothetical protein